MQKQLKPDNMTNHPEGGRFQEVFRSDIAVTTSSGTARCSMTHIYFELKQGEHSRFHKVTADEVWNLYQGAIRLYLWNQTDSSVVTIELSEEHGSYCHVIPAGIWQAAEPLSDKALVGCSVAPGFEFEDFTMLDQSPEAAHRLKALAPQLQHLC